MFIGFFVTSLLLSLGIKSKDNDWAAGYAEQALSMIKSVTAFGMQETERVNYSRLIQWSNKNWGRYGCCNGISYGLSNFVFISSAAYGLSIGALFVYYNVHWGTALYDGGDIGSIMYAIVMGMFLCSSSAASIGKIREGIQYAYEIEELLRNEKNIITED